MDLQVHEGRADRQTMAVADGWKVRQAHERDRLMEEVAARHCRHSQC